MELIALCLAQADVIRTQALQLAAQDQRLAAQDQQLAVLRGEVERLRRLVSRNSGNSSLPPSTDGLLPGRPSPSPDAPTGQEPKPADEPERPRGKQRGAPGSALGWVADAQVVDHRPEGACGGCGVNLDAAKDAGVARACQVTDAPPVTVTVTEHRMHAVVCGCGRRHIAEGPPEARVDTACTYGPNLRALAVYLLVFHALPVERVCRLLLDVTGAGPSPGFVHAMLAETAAALTEATKLIRAFITLAHVVHFDETTLRVGGRGAKRYVWVAATRLYTLYYLGRRSKKAFLDWGLGPQITRVAIHDNYSVYYSEGSLGEQAVHQLCVAHLLRHLTDAAESHPQASWPKAATAALQSLVHAHHVARAANLRQIPAEIAGPLIEQFREAVDLGLAEIPRRKGKQVPARNLLTCLRRREADVLRFCFDTQIEPTNNQAESDLRPHKTQQKISGRLTSEDATRHRLTIRGYISTAVKHGVDVMAALRDTVLGHPWMPPAPIRA